MKILAHQGELFFLDQIYRAQTKVGHNFERNIIFQKTNRKLTLKITFLACLEDNVNSGSDWGPDSSDSEDKPEDPPPPPPPAAAAGA